MQPRSVAQGGDIWRLGREPPLVAGGAVGRNRREPSVTFVHLACSGATIWEGILGPYAGIEEVAPAHPPQLEVVGELAAVDPAHVELGLHRPVDAIVLSIGGNDVNFAGIIEKCITYADCPDAPVIDSTALAARTAYCSAAPLWSRSECFAELAPPDLESGIDAEELFLTGDPANPLPNGLADLPQLRRSRRFDMVVRPDLRTSRATRTVRSAAGRSGTTSRRARAICSGSAPRRWPGPPAKSRRRSRTRWR
jgi:hypothetical protein